MTQFHGTINGEPLSEKVKEARRRDFDAFPVQKYEGSWQEGMKLRDYFAAKAMQGLVSNGAYDQANLIGLTNYAYLLADYMMEKREEQK